jgi:hypothetical protein
MKVRASDAGSFLIEFLFPVALVNYILYVDSLKFYHTY